MVLWCIASKSPFFTALSPPAPWPEARIHPRRPRPLRLSGSAACSVWPCWQATGRDTRTPPGGSPAWLGSALCRGPRRGLLLVSAGFRWTTKNVNKTRAWERLNEASLLLEKWHNRTRISWWNSTRLWRVPASAVPLWPGWPPSPSPELRPTSRSWCSLVKHTERLPSHHHNVILSHHHTVAPSQRHTVAPSQRHTVAASDVCFQLPSVNCSFTATNNKHLMSM